MTDVFTKKKRSEIMSKIRAKNTRPELLVRRFLFAKGFRYRLHKKGLPGSPDIVLNKYNTVVFVNGCFWHGHEGCPTFKMPQSRVSYWKSKIRRNKERDASVIKALKKLNWNVIVVWECQLKKKNHMKTLEGVVDKIMKSQ